MATDSTELTFVRCPSCRSLVPAISTRCRMCGATIDASSKPDAAERDPKQASRVRQRTMSQPENELSATAGKIREEEAVRPIPAPMPVSEPPPARAAEPSAKPAEVSADPLAAFMVGADETVTEPETAFVPAEDPIVPEEEEPAAIAPVEVAAPRPQPALVVPPPEPPPVREARTAGVATSPELIVESGARGGKSSGLQFGKPAERPAERPAPKPSERPRNEPRARDAEGQSRGMHPRQHNEAGRAEPRSQDAGARRGEHQERAQDRSHERAQERTHDEGRGRGEEARSRPRDEAPAPRPERASRPERTPRPVEPEAAASGVAGRLFGWLVSYARPEGSAIELREGKFFIAQKRTKPQDIVLAEDGVSSPHALCKVSVEGGFIVQDMLSERGVFVRKRATDVYRREEEAVRVEHGDWLRIGDVEFLVSLVAHVGEV